MKKYLTLALIGAALLSGSVTSHAYCVRPYYYYPVVPVIPAHAGHWFYPFVGYDQCGNPVYGQAIWVQDY